MAKKNKKKKASGNKPGNKDKPEKKKKDGKKTRKNKNRKKPDKHTPQETSRQVASEPVQDRLRSTVAPQTRNTGLLTGFWPRAILIGAFILAGSALLCSRVTDNKTDCKPAREETDQADPVTDTDTDTDTGSAEPGSGFSPASQPTEQAAIDEPGRLRETPVFRPLETPDESARNEPAQPAERAPVENSRGQGWGYSYPRAPWR